MNVRPDDDHAGWRRENPVIASDAISISGGHRMSIATASLQHLDALAHIEGISGKRRADIDVFSPGIQLQERCTKLIGKHAVSIPARDRNTLKRENVT